MGAGHKPSQERPMRPQAPCGALWNCEEIRGWKEGNVVVLQRGCGLPHELPEEEFGKTTDTRTFRESE